MDAEDEHNVSQSLDRKLRLKALLDRAQQLDHDLATCTDETALQSIRSMIEQSDQIISEGEVKDRAQHTTEVVMDAHVLKINHELVSKVLQHNMEFNEKSYLNSIKNIVYKAHSPDWDAFANIVCKMARTVNLQSSMLGAVEAELKLPAASQRRQRRNNVLADEKRPETIKALKRQDKGAEKVNIIHRQLVEIFKRSHCDTMPFYKLIVDPHNFMNTVENAFQLSFLARDNKIGLKKGEDGHPCVRLISSAENKTQKDTSQWICSLDMEKCDEMARFYKIKQPLLKIELDYKSDDDDEEDSMDTD